jgi:hypothetical protein
MRRTLWGALSVAVACGGGDAVDGIDTGGSQDSSIAVDTSIPGDTAAPGSTCALRPDGVWQAPSFDAHVAEALALRAAIDALNSSLRAAEQDGVSTLSAAAWLEALDSGSPSAGSVLTSAWRPVVEGSLAVFADADANGAVALLDGEAWAAPGVGGVVGNDARLLSGGGIEPRQVFEKGIIAGGGLYAWALAQTADGVQDADIDAIAAAFGVDVAFDPAATRTDASNYTYAMGFYAPVRSGLARARAYLASEDCVAERDAALASAFGAWERGMVLRGYFYADLARDMVAANPDEDTLVDALHELSEGVAMIGGFRGLQGPGSGPFAAGLRQLDDAQLDRILDALGVDLVDLNRATTGPRLLDATGRDRMVSDVEAALSEGYGISPAEVQAFLAPTPG